MSSKDWWKCKLDDLIEKRNQGVNTTTEKVKYSEKGIPVIRAQNITSSGLSFDDIVYVSSETFARVREECKPIKNDVLYTNIGSQFGTACVVDVDYPFLIAWNVLRIQTKKRTNPFFLKYVLNNPEIRSMIRGMNSSSTMPFVSGKEIGSIDLLVPDFFIQTHIALTLSALDDKIELNRQTNQTLEAIAQAIYKEWFVNFNFPTSEGKPYRDSGGEMQDSELGTIPNGWRIQSLGEVSKVITKGTTPTTLGDKFVKKGVAFLRAECIQDDLEIDYLKSLFITHETHTKLKRSQLVENDILITIAGTIGRIGMVTKRILPANTNQAIGIIRIDQKFLPVTFAFFYLKQRKVKDELLSGITQSVQANISLTDLRNLKIIIPPKTITKQFDSVITKQYIENMTEQSSILVSIRNVLLPKLMSGEIEV